MTIRRKTLKICREISKLPSDEVFWVWNFVTSGLWPPADDDLFDRNGLILRYWRRWHPILTVFPAAREIARELAIYHDGEWQHDKNRDKPLTSDDRRRDLHRILKAGRLIGFEAIKKILER